MVQQAVIKKNCSSSSRINSSSCSFRLKQQHSSKIIQRRSLAVIVLITTTMLSSIPSSIILKKSQQRASMMVRPLSVSAFQAIVVNRPNTYRWKNSHQQYHPYYSSLQSQRLIQPSTTTTLTKPSPILPNTYNDNSFRLYSSNRNNNEDDGGILSKAASVAKNVAKSILPSSWFRTEEEKKQALVRQQMKDEVSGGINELFKDAPFPIRAFSKSILAPLISNLASGLAETVAEQQSSIQSVLQQAENLIQQDDAVCRALGGNSITIGTPFSQSSSTVSINGQTTSRVELAFPITGSSSQAIGRMLASNGVIQSMDVDINGRRISVDTSITPSSSTARFKSSASSSSSSIRNNVVNGDDNIIEAEIIEKTPTRK